MESDGSTDRTDGSQNELQLQSGTRAVEKSKDRSIVDSISGAQCLYSVETTIDSRLAKLEGNECVVE